MALACFSDEERRRYEAGSINYAEAIEIRRRVLKRREPWSSAPPSLPAGPSRAACRPVTRNIHMTSGYNLCCARLCIVRCIWNALHCVGPPLLLSDVGSPGADHLARRTLPRPDAGQLP